MSDTKEEMSLMELVRFAADEALRSANMTVATAKEQYLHLIKELLGKRASALRDGGTLSDAIEDDYCDRLDDLWKRLTSDEIREIEQQLAEAQKG